jgi:hypothetical protein
VTATRRRALLFALLGGAAGWSAWLALQGDPAGEAGLVEPVQRTRTAAAAPASPAAARRVPPPATGGTRLDRMRADLFPEQTWYVPPPPPPPPPYVPPPPPQAPALPYAYMGRWLDGGDATWYLTRGSQPVSVRTGQVLDGVWRLDAVAAGALTFTYLPLNQTRSLRTGD